MRAYYVYIVTNKNHSVLYSGPWNSIYTRWRLFQRIKVYKRISTRYEKLALTFLKFVLVAAVFDWLKSFRGHAAC
jgi:transposase